jgi:hypothetical protein
VEEDGAQAVVGEVLHQLDQVLLVAMEFQAAVVLLVEVQQQAAQQLVVQAVVVKLAVAVAAAQ